MVRTTVAYLLQDLRDPVFLFSPVGWNEMRGFHFRIAMQKATGVQIHIVTFNGKPEAAFGLALLVAALRFHSVTIRRFDDQLEMVRAMAEAWPCPETEIAVREVEAARGIRAH
jgi:hypothetical protein